MKKYIARTFYFASVALILWVGLSWVDIVADNTSNSPNHSKYNIFVMVAESQNQDTEVFATIESMYENIITFKLEDGGFYVIESSQPEAYDVYGYYKLIINSNDEVIKIYREVW